MCYGDTARHPQMDTEAPFGFLYPFGLSFIDPVTLPPTCHQQEPPKTTNAALKATSAAAKATSRAKTGKTATELHGAVAKDSKTREASRRSRLRKKAYIEGLEQAAGRMQEQRLQLETQLRALEAENATLKEQLDDVRLVIMHAATHGLPQPQLPQPLSLPQPQPQLQQQPLSPYSDPFDSLDTFSLEAFSNGHSHSYSHSHSDPKAPAATSTPDDLGLDRGLDSDLSGLSPFAGDPALQLFAHQSGSSSPNCSYYTFADDA